jgi:hypothetical protein
MDKVNSEYSAIKIEKTTINAKILRFHAVLQASKASWGGRGRRFKSCHSDQENGRCKISRFSFIIKLFPHFSGADFLLFLLLKMRRKMIENEVGT